jgi:hypothetical protein
MRCTLKKRRSGKTTKILELYHELVKTQNVKIMVNSNFMGLFHMKYEIPKVDVICASKLQGIRCDTLLIDEFLMIVEDERLQHEVMNIIELTPRPISYSTLYKKTPFIYNLIKYDYPELLL